VTNSPKANVELAGRLANRVAIVTGAGAGIGYAITARLAAEGAHTVIAERDVASGAAAAEALGVPFVETDVRDSDSIRAAIDFTVSHFGTVDVLVNNAGITRYLDFFETTADQWDRIHAVNSRGVFLFMQAAARAMVDGKHDGSIVNISSIAGKGHHPISSAAYAASKGAVIALTRIAAMQLAPHRIRVNAICPGITRSHALLDVGKYGALSSPVSRAWAGAATDESRAYFRTIVDKIPLGRPSEPEHIASLAAFLASAESETITGQSWNVDGGLVFD